MVTVANPIYDIVFKYMMEDERIARTIRSKDSQQMLDIDDSVYAGDAEMEHIIHRLLMAATDANMRQDMNVEDEYFSIIEKRDTEIMMRDRQLAEQNVQLAEQNVQLAEQNARLAEQKAQLTEQKAQIEQQKAQISSTIKDLETLLASRMQYWFD